MKRLWYLLCAIAFCLALAGCNSGDEDASKTTVEEFLTLYQSTDSRAGAYLAGRDNGIDGIELQFNGIQALLAERMTFSVNGSEKTDDGYLVSVQINSIDFKAAFESVTERLSDDTPEDAILEELYNTLEADSAEIREFAVDIPVQKTGEEYKIVLTSELSNALFGGYNEYLTELTGEMINEQKNN